MNRDGVKAEAKQGERQCPLCWDPARRLGTVSCPTCETRYHSECADELDGRCALLGCPGRLPTTPPAREGFLEHFQGRPHHRRRRRRGRLGRRWSAVRQRFSVVHAVCGALIGIMVAVVLVGRIGGSLSSLVGAAALFGVVGGLRVGFQQDAFWRRWTGGSAAFGHRRWRL